MLDLKAIVDKCTFHKYNKTYCYIPCGSEKLIILLSAHNQNNKYFLFRSFLENQKYDLLFITDNNTWYLDDDKGSSYIKIFLEFIEIYGSNNIIVFGSSMGGYGAVLFASELNINCLVCNPQIDLNVSKDWAWEELSNDINKIVKSNKQVDIIKKLEVCENNSVYFLIYGNNPLDVINANLFLTMCKNEKRMIVYQYDDDTHEFPFGKNIDLIYKCFNIIYEYSNIYLPKTNKSYLPTLNRHKRRKYHKYELFEMSMEKYVDFYKCSLWSLRSKIEKNGLYLFSDIGFLNKDNLSGIIVYRYAEEKYYMVFPSKDFLNNYGMCMSLKKINDISNNIYI